MKCFAFFFALCVNTAWAADSTPIEVYLNVEKPTLGPSSVWSEDHPITLNFARDEIKTLLVRLSLPSKPKHVLPLDHATLRMAAGHSANLHLKTYVAAAQYFDKSSARPKPAGEFTDILIPNELAAKPGFHIPPGNAPSRPVYAFDLHALPNAKPGDFDGVLQFKLAQTLYSIPLHVRVFATTLPKKLELRSSFGFAPWPVLLKHYGAWNEKELELYKKYFALATEHRIDLHKIYLSLPSAADAAKNDLLSFSAKPEQAFTALWDELESGQSTPFGFRWSTTDLPVVEELKYPRTDDPQGLRIAEEYWRALDSSVASHGLERDTFVYFIDEPQKKEFAKIARAIKLIKTWAPHLQFLSTVAYDPQLDGAIDIWVENLFLWDLKGSRLPAAKKLWLYVGCNSHGCSGPENLMLPDLVTDRPTAYHLALPIMAVRFHAEGILYYDTVYGYTGSDGLAPWKDPFAFTGYGEGNLFYPCSPKLCGTDDQVALPSLRLKAMRDGMQDAEILLLAREKGAPVDDWLKELIPDVRHFPLEAAAYERIKVRALEFLSNTAAPPRSPPHRADTDK